MAKTIIGFIPKTKETKKEKVDNKTKETKKEKVDNKTKETKKEEK